MEEWRECSFPMAASECIKQPTYTAEGLIEGHHHPSVALWFLLHTRRDKWVCEGFCLFVLYISCSFLAPHTHFLHTAMHLRFAHLCEGKLYFRSIRKQPVGLSLTISLKRRNLKPVQVRFFSLWLMKESSVQYSLQIYGPSQWKSSDLMNRWTYGVCIDFDR